MRLVENDMDNVDELYPDSEQRQFILATRLGAVISELNEQMELSTIDIVGALEIVKFEQMVPFMGPEE